jgi:uncharacterized protein YbbC (DUF1343 family)
MRTSPRLPRRIPGSRAFPAALILTMAWSVLSGSVSDAGKALPSGRVRLGNEVFCDAFPAELAGKRLGLIMNQTSVLPGGPSLLDRLLADGRPVTAVFTPEHGLRGTVEGGETIGGGKLNNIPVYSLYGGQTRPTPAQLENVDALVYDIQDVGTRFYTYITTLKYVIEAAAGAAKPVYVLDRPNPLGGRIVEGPLLDRQFESFIAPLPIPTRYGLTAGELALMMKGEGWVATGADIRVITAANWTRARTWSHTGLPWIPPSPNIPTPESALAYPGLGLLGGVKVNQGLGTDLPFLQFGAPWMDPEAVIRAWTTLQEFPVRLEPVTYTPRAQPGKTQTPPYRDRACRGLRIFVTDPEEFHALRFALELFDVLKKLYPDKIVVASGTMNRMFGNESLAAFIGGEIGFSSLLRQVEADEEKFRESRQKYLLYADQ